MNEAGLSAAGDCAGIEVEHLLFGGLARAVWWNASFVTVKQSYVIGS